MTEQLPTISKHAPTYTHTETTKVFRFRAYAFFQNIFQKTPILGSNKNKIRAIV